MNDQPMKSNQKEKLDRKAKSRNEKKLKSSSKLGFMTVFACVAIALLSFVVTTSFSANARPQPKFVPADALKASALSTSWVCPISGAGIVSNSVVISNPDTSRTANVEISLFDSLGNKIGSEIVKVEPNSFLIRSPNSLGAKNDTSLFVDSFSAPIAVFRSLKLSDGEELLGCVNDLRSTASFPNLTTIRNANSTLVLSNPYDEAVVVDINATLITLSEGGAIPTLDDIKGQIIPAKGRLDLDLQNQFGRFDVVSVDVASRSGFFAAEALIAYSGATGSNGQTVVSAASELANRTQLNWAGVDPTRIIAKNGSKNTFSLNSKALATDQRSLSPEPTPIPAGTSAILENLGLDFGIRNITLEVEEGSNKANNIYAAWIHASDSAVSSGSQKGQNSKSHLVPVTSGDRLNIFNSGKKQVKITYSILGSRAVKSMTINPGIFTVVDLSELEISAATVVQLNADRKVIVSSSNSTSSRFTPSIEVLP
jgi:hypothetical protein